MNKKIILSIFITVFAFIGLIFNISAEEAYITYENAKYDGNDVNGWSASEGIITYSMNNATDYEFTLKGYNLDLEEDYIFSLKSDFVDYEKSYTGQELTNGVFISRNDGNSKIIATLISDSTSEIIPIKENDNYYQKLNLYFNNNIDAPDIDAKYNEIVSQGGLNINAILPDDIQVTEVYVSASLKKFETEKYWIIGYCENIDNCHLIISDKEKYDRQKDYKVKYTFAETNKKIKEKVKKYAKKFESSDSQTRERLFVLEDLENINYLYARGRNKSFDINMINQSINYSSELQKLLENGNLTGILDARAGWGSHFQEGEFGFLNLVYDGTVYGHADSVGTKRNNIIYVPNNTPNTREAYISVAEDRIKKYLSSENVSIRYAGQIADLNDDIDTINEIVDISKTLGEYYILSIGDIEYYYLIAKDSSKIKKPKLITEDMNTNMIINTEDSSVPLDSKIKSHVISSNSKEYKDLLKKLKKSSGIVFDIDLFSNSINTYIKKLENGKFEVYIPLDERYLNKQLIVYYVREDGSIEEHNVKVQDGYAVFETNHFSTYTLAIKDDTKNPETGDNILLYVSLLLLSVVGIISIKVSTKKVK